MEGGYGFLLDLALIFALDKLLGFSPSGSSCPRWWARCWPASFWAQLC